MPSILHRNTTSRPARSERLAASLAALLIGLSTGCTSLQTLTPDPSPAPVLGVPYALPSLYYDLSISRELVECRIEKESETKGEGKSKKKSEKSETTKVRPVFLVEVTAKPSYERGELLAIDPEHLKTFTKTTSLKLLFYPNGTVKSINAAATDHGPEVVSGVVKSGFSIARMATELNVTPGASESVSRESERYKASVVAGTEPETKPETKPSSPSTFSCPTESLKDIVDFIDKSKRLTDELGALGKQLESLQIAAVLGGLTEGDKKQLIGLVRKAAEINGKIADAKKLNTSIRARLRSVENVKLVPSATALSQTLSFPSADAVVRQSQQDWLNQYFKPNLDFSPSTTPSTPEVADLRTQLSLVASMSLESATSGPGKALPRIIEGFAYRLPARATLRICALAPSASCLDRAESADLLTSTDAAPQYGRLVVLPLKNSFGEDTELLAAFAESGELSTVTYESRKAIGAQIANTLVDTTSAAESFLGQKRKAAADRAAAADAKAATDLDSTIKAVESQKRLIDAQTAVDPTNIAQDRAQAALNQQLAQLTTQKAIADLQDALNKAKPSSP